MLSTNSFHFFYHLECSWCLNVIGPPSRNGYLVHRSKVGSIVAGCIGAYLEMRKVKSVEHALSSSLHSKPLPLPLPYSHQKFLAQTLESSYNILTRILIYNIYTFCEAHFTAFPASLSSPPPPPYNVQIKRQMV